MPTFAAVHAAGAELVYEVWYAVHLLATYPRIVILFGLVAGVIAAALFAVAVVVVLLADALDALRTSSAACARNLQLSSWASPRKPPGRPKADAGMNEHYV